MDLELEFEPEALELLPAEEGLTGGDLSGCYFNSMLVIITFRPEDPE